MAFDFLMKFFRNNTTRISFRSGTYSVSNTANQMGYFFRFIHWATLIVLTTVNS